MEPNTKRLRNNTIALMVIQILNYVLPFITLPYVSRIFTVEKFGIIFFAQVLMDYFFRFVMFGFDLSGVRALSLNYNDNTKINKIFSAIISVQLIFLIIGLVVLSLLVLTVPNFQKDWLIYLLSYLSLIGQIFIFTWFYQGMEKMKFITILNIITRLSFLILIFACIRKPNDYILYPLFNSLSYIIAGGVSVIFVKKYFKIKYIQPKAKDIVETIKKSSEFFLTKIAIALYRQTNAFILGLACTSTIVAYYVAADKIFWAVFSLYLTFVNALFPYMSKTKDIVLFKKILKYLILISAGASIFLFFASKYLIIIFFSEKYIESIKILQIFSISFAFYIFVDTLGFPLLGAFGHIREANTGYIVGGIFNVIGLIWLFMFKNINIHNVAILVSSTYVIMFLHRIYYIKKYKLLE